MEPASAAGRVAMLRADVGWSDLGSWAALRDALVARLPGAIDPAHVSIQPIGPSIGPHLGPGCIGAVVLYRR